MKITKEAKKENEKTILKLWSCQCGNVLLIDRPVLIKQNGHNNVLDHFRCVCPKCETWWKVKITFEEM